MFKIMLKKICFVFVFISLFGCASSGAISNGCPVWVTAADDVYSGKEFLNAVGCGLTRQEAENAAIGQLARNIRQNIISSSDASKTLIGNDVLGYDTNYDYSLSVEAITEVKNIPGVNIRETWISKDKTIYVLAQLNREEVGRHFRKQIDEKTAVIESEILYAKANTGTFEALAALENASKEAILNQENMDMLAGINPDMYRLVSPDYQSAATVCVLTAREQEKVKISVNVEGDSEERISTAFKTVLSSQGLRITDNPNDARYCLNATVNMSEIDVNNKYEYVRYVLSAQLIDNVSQKVLVPYTENGREAHISQGEACQRAYRTIESAVTKKYKVLLTSYLDSLR